MTDPASSGSEQAAVDSPVEGLTIGIDMGGTKCLGLLVGQDGTVFDREQQATQVGPDAVIETLCGVAESLRSRSAGQIVSVGLGVPGLVDRDGVLHAGPHLPGVHRLAIAARVGERLGLPVVADNDATCATHAELILGAARGATQALLVTIGTGIGAGLILDGHVMRGANGFAGEVGHMCVQPDGPPCICGRRGCWELYASGRRAGSEVTAAARRGSTEGLAVLRELSRWLAFGLANLTLAFDPHLIVVGGGVLERAADLIIPQTRQFLEHDFGLAGGHRPIPELRAAELGPDAGAIGAALLAPGVERER